MSDPLVPTARTRLVLQALSLVEDCSGRIEQALAQGHLAPSDAAALWGGLRMWLLHMSASRASAPTVPSSLPLASAIAGRAAVRLPEASTTKHPDGVWTARALDLARRISALSPEVPAPAPESKGAVPLADASAGAATSLNAGAGEEAHPSAPNACVSYFGARGYSPVHLEMLLQSLLSLRGQGSELPAYLFHFGAGAEPVLALAPLREANLTIVQLDDYTTTISELLGGGLGAIFAGYPHAAKHLVLPAARARGCERLLILDYDTFVLRSPDALLGELTAADFYAVPEALSDRWRADYHEILGGRVPAAPQYLSEDRIADVARHVCGEEGARVRMLAPFQNAVMLLNRHALAAWSTTEYLALVFRTLARFLPSILAAEPEYDGVQGKDTRRLPDMLQLGQSDLARLELWRRVAPPGQVRSDLAYPSTNSFFAENLVMWVTGSCTGGGVRSGGEDSGNESGGEGRRDSCQSLEGDTVGCDGLEQGFFGTEHALNQPDLAYSSKPCGSRPFIMHTQSSAWRASLHGFYTHFRNECTPWVPLAAEQIAAASRVTMASEDAGADGGSAGDGAEAWVGEPYSSALVIDSIRALVSSGELAHLENFLRPARAEALHEQLVGATAWVPIQWAGGADGTLAPAAAIADVVAAGPLSGTCLRLLDVTAPYGGLQMMYRSLQEPLPALEALERYLNGDEARALFERYSGLKLGRAMLQGSWYARGDHLTTHNDYDKDKKLAVVFHLTKGWEDGWGGELLWCARAAPHKVKPLFNALSIFLVQPDERSDHAVLPVGPGAPEADPRRRRLAVTGWYYAPGTRREDAVGRAKVVE